MKNVVCALVSACVLAAVWFEAPLILELLPENVAALLGVPPKDAAADDGTSGTPAAAAPKAASSQPKGEDLDALFDELTGEGAKAARPAPKKAKPAADGEITETNFRKAKWCVLVRETAVYDADGKEVGVVKGGRFFNISRVEGSARRGSVWGNFTPKALPKEVRFPVGQAIYFSGTPESVAEADRPKLRAYYELVADLAKRRQAVIAEAGKRSPFFAAAVKAKKAYDAAVAKVDVHDDDARNGKLKAEVEDLARAAREASAKHKAWKEKHADEIKKADPEADAGVKEIRRKMQALAEELPAGMCIPL